MCPSCLPVFRIRREQWDCTESERFLRPLRPRGNIADLREDGLHFGIKAKPPPTGASSPALPLGRNGSWEASPRCAGREASGASKSRWGRWEGIVVFFIFYLPASTVVGTAPSSGTACTPGRFPCGSGQPGPEDPKPTLHLYGACRSQSLRSSVFPKETLNDT